MANHNATAPFNNMNEGEATSPSTREVALLLAISGRAVSVTEPGCTVTPTEPPPPKIDKKTYNRIYHAKRRADIKKKSMKQNSLATRNNSRF